MFHRDFPARSHMTVSASGRESLAVERRKIDSACFGLSTSHCQVSGLGPIRSHLTVTAISRSPPTSPKRVTVDLRT